MKILLIDENQEVLKTLSLTLRFLWPEATLLTATGGLSGTEMAEAESPDAIILELNLRDMDGFEALRQIRLFSDVPIIVLTDMNAEIDMIRSLEAGADDYITKPFSPLDLLARTKATLRRAGLLHFDGQSPRPFAAGDLVVDFSAREVLLNGEPVHLTPIE